MKISETAHSTGGEVGHTQDGGVEVNGPERSSASVLRWRKETEAKDDG